MDKLNNITDNKEDSTARFFHKTTKACSNKEHGASIRTAKRFIKEAESMGYTHIEIRCPQLKSVPEYEYQKELDIKQLKALYFTDNSKVNYKLMKENERLEDNIKYRDSFLIHKYERTIRFLKQSIELKEGDAIILNAKIRVYTEVLTDIRLGSKT